MTTPTVFTLTVTDGLRTQEAAELVDISTREGLPLGAVILDGAREALAKRQRAAAKPAPAAEEPARAA